MEHAAPSILYRDPYLVAIHKPAGLLVHRSAIDAHEQRDAVQALRDAIGGRVQPVHRLDKATSGVLVFSLEAATTRALGQAFEGRAVAKTYLAVVRGHPPEAGEIDHPLARDPEAPGERVEAVTRYRRLGIAELHYPVDRYPTSRYALLELEPLTGRRHQLRRHLKHVSHPIIGDTTYGKGGHNRLFATLFGCRRLLLACTALAFAHPMTGEPLRIVAPLAGEFADVVARLGWTEAASAAWRDAA